MDVVGVVCSGVAGGWRYYILKGCMSVNAVVMV